MGQDVPEVAGEDGNRLRQVLGLAVAGVGRKQVRARVLFTEVELPVQADGLGHGHEGSLATDAPEPVTVGTGQEIDVRRGQDLRESEVPGSLVGRMHQVVALVEEAVRPGQLHEVAVEDARQGLVVGGFLDGAAEMVDELGHQVGEELEVIEHLLLAVGIPEMEDGRRFLLLR